MNRFIKYLFGTLIALATLGLSSCNKERDKVERPDKLEVVSLDKIDGNLNEGLKVTMTVRNNSGFNVRISAAEAFLQYKSRKIGRLVANGEVVLPRRSTTQVVVPIRITVPNLLISAAAFKLINEGKYDDFTINYNATVHAGKITMKMKDESMTLKEFIKGF